LISKNPQGDQCLESQGPRPFVTRRVHRLDDGTLAVWSSRHHRKDLPLPEALVDGAIRRACLRGWCSVGGFNWWIGLVFAVGSLLFILGSVLILWPSLVGTGAFKPAHVFFVGSLPFTLAACLQFYQAGNATDFPVKDSTPVQRKLFGCRLRELGWWSCLLQFIGTLLFNVSTYQALNPNLDWISEDIRTWVPNLIGSILFLLSGYMAFAETCHAYWRCLPRNLSWWAVLWNLAGCIGFLVSALLAVLVSAADPAIRLQLSTGFTLLGATGFLLGSLLLMPEAATEGEKHPSPDSLVEGSPHQLNDETVC
jgi:hypothetical protein